VFTTVDARWAFTEAAIVVQCANEHDARLRLREEYDIWSELAARFGVPKALLQYRRGRQTKAFKVLASEQERATVMSYSNVLNFDTLHSVDLPITRRLLSALDAIAENPGEQWFLHRISPDLNRMTQIAVSESAASLIVGATPQQALNRDRRDYVDSNSLEDLKRLLRQQMSVGSSVETRWVGFSPVTKNDWRRFNYLYTIVDELPTGELIQLGKCLGVEPIAAPVRR
jgi:hypothetical protein